MAVTIKDAGAERGFSSTDHLIVDCTAEVIGKSYKSAQTALEAAEKKVRLSGYVHPFAWVQLIHCDGSTTTHRSE